eukprot:423658_1
MHPPCIRSNSGATLSRLSIISNMNAEITMVTISNDCFTLIDINDSNFSSGYRIFIAFGVDITNLYDFHKKIALIMIIVTRPIDTDKMNTLSVKQEHKYNHVLVCE